MKLKHLLIVVWLLTASLLVAAQPLYAQDLGQGTQEGTQTSQRVGDRPVSDEQELEAFRAELSVTSGKLLDFALMLAEDTFGFAGFSDLALENAEQLTALRQMIPNLSLTELAVMKEFLSRSPRWRETPEALMSIFTSEIRQKLKAISDAAKKTGRIVSIQTPPCSDITGFPASGSTTRVGVFIAKGVALAAEIVKEVIPEDSATSPAYVPAAVLWGVAETASLIVEGLVEVDNECVDALFQADTTDKLTDMQPRIVDIQTRVNDIQTRVIDIQAQITETRKREIEESVDWCRPLVSIYLPAPNGRIEEVRDFVQLFITNSVAAFGLPAAPLTGLFLTAQNFHTQGVNSLGNSKFKEAFQFFCKSYAALVRAADAP